MRMAPFRIAVPKAVEVSTALETVYNNLTSLAFLNVAESLSPATTWVAQSAGGVPEDRRANRLVWVPETAATLTAEQRHRNRLVFDALGEALITKQEWPDFVEYLDDLQAQEPVTLRDQMLARILNHLPEPHTVDASALLADVDTYLDVVEMLYPDEPIDRGLQTEAHTLLNDPPRMQQVIVEHLREMWSTRLADEWKRNSTLLSSLVTMLRRHGLPSGSAVEVIRAFVGRDLPSSSALLAGVEQLIFVPSAHVGLYASKFGTESTLWVFVNTTVIMGWTLRQAPVGRPELLARLSTLADETRLRILELLARHDELHAQAIMAQLELTQSSASRHLNQLRGLGFIVERRGEGASKLYQLNRPQFDWTFRAIERLLAGESATEQMIQPDRPDEIRNFLDRNGRVESWPAKRKVQQVLLRYLVERFEPGRRYSEREVNAVLNEWHTFNDHATLRRDMYDERLFDRTRDGMQYWRVTESTPS